MLFILLSLALLCNYGLAQLTVIFDPLVDPVMVPVLVTVADVSFYLATQSHPDLVLITSENAALVDPSKPTRFITHGYLQNYQRPWMLAMKDEYVATYDFNIILVDWQRPALLPYPLAAESVDVIGKTIAQFIIDKGLTPGSVTVIGHSLGGHVAGYAGQYLIAAGKLLGEIVALDPAGPLFRELNTTTDADRLSKDDAAVVVAIHTDSGFYGYENPAGTLDIYPNTGSRVQPGCTEDTITFSSFESTVECSHSRSHEYLTDSIRKGKFQCQFCDPPSGTYTYGGVCNDNGKRASYGAEDFTASTTGICFAPTNSAEPFLN